MVETIPLRSFFYPSSTNKFLSLVLRVLRCLYRATNALTVLAAREERTIILIIRWIIFLKNSLIYRDIQN
ncbi:MAG: hypothetical protein GF308_09080 [Candidatus Heimdallarchaeota archaeon]|nr:hypothetical protein [Candidatus Heimdallarchaeota archaeon]